MFDFQGSVSPSGTTGIKPADIPPEILVLSKQAAQIEKQMARIADLELQQAKAKKDSTTSSKPPSSDSRGL